MVCQGIFQFFLKKVSLVADRLLTAVPCRAREQALR